MRNELQNYMGRPKRYSNIDGTGEMAFGLMALGFTLLGYLQTVLPKNSTWNHGFVGVLFMYAVLLPVLGLILWVPRTIKRHITWPRTGYVKFHTTGESRRRWWTWMVASAVISAVIAAGVACLARFDRRHDWISLLWLGNVAVFVAGYTFWIFRMERDHPWKWLVALLMALGLLAIALIVPGDIAGLRWLMLLFVGLMWLGSGGATLYLYIRHTQPPTPDAE